MPTALTSGRSGRARLAAIALGIALVVPVPPTVLATDGLFLPYQTIAVPSEPDAITVGDVTAMAAPTSC